MRESLKETHLREEIPGCSGCTACMNACPKGAIKMKKESNGFLYPIIEESLCIGCQKCIKTCPVYQWAKQPEIHTNGPSEAKAYGGWILDEEIRMQSSSGGIFSALALHTLSQGGVVYGAHIDDELNIKHIRIDNKADLKKLRGSKYKQSDLGFCYQSAKNDIKAGRAVLFSGVPCQIGGLIAYLGGKRPENLLSVDIVCHGVPSDELFDAYIHYQESLHAGKKITHVNFRDKSTGWKSYSLSATFSDGGKYTEYSWKDPYMRGFLSDLHLRPGCYECVYHKQPRLADITLGDFWGVEGVAPELDNTKGVSLILIHTAIGEQALNSIKDACYLQTVPFELAIKGNPSYFRSSHKPKDYATWNEKTAQATPEEWMQMIIKRHHVSFINRVKGKIKKILKAVLKRIGLKK